MDVKQKKEKLQGQAAELGKRRRGIEEKLNAQETGLQRAIQQRTGLVEELSGADTATAGWAQAEIDKLDRQIVNHKRFTEAHQSALAKVTAEAAAVAAELAEVEKVIQQGVREKTFAEWTANINQLLASTEQALNASRSGLGELNISAARGVAEFEGRAARFLEPLLDEFFIRKDWGAAWRNWVRNHVEFRQRRRPSATQGGNRAEERDRNNLRAAGLIG